MKGANELQLNQATLVEAVQEYLDQRTTNKCRVTVESVTGQVVNGHTSYFKVKVTEAEEPPVLADHPVLDDDDEA